MFTSYAFHGGQSDFATHSALCRIPRLTDRGASASPFSFSLLPILAGTRRCHGHKGAQTTVRRHPRSLCLRSARTQRIASPLPQRGTGMNDCTCRLHPGLVVPPDSLHRDRRRALACSPSSRRAAKKVGSLLTRRAMETYELPSRTPTAVTRADRRDR